jgi:hypothetical protein
MDFILTELGREQASQGELNVRYATFSDRATFYSSGSLSGIADDASSRIYFEAASSPHDTIVVENDFAGKVKSFRANDLTLEGGEVINVTSLPGKSSVIEGEAIIQQSVEILNSITASFRNTQFIRTTDMFMEGRDFVAEPKTLYFSYNDDPNLPITAEAKSQVVIDSMPSLFQDHRLAHLPNFRFMPPRNAPNSSNLEGNSMGEYIKFRDEFSNSQDPQQTHRISMQSGFEKRDIYFTEKTPDNNVIMQPFEFTDKGMTKLSIIDGGEYIKASTRERRHVFHIGKLFADTKKTTTYVHIFTLVFREIN